MLLVFVDETSDSKFKDYFGLSIAVINHTHYKTIKDGFQKILKASHWDESIEFKGSYLFSATKGDTNVGIDERIDIANKVISLNIAKKNARMRFFYLRHKVDKKKQGEEYLKVLPLLLNKALPCVTKATKGSGKDIIAITCDYRSDISATQIHNAVEPVVKSKKFTLLEEVTMASSKFHTVGILYADIIGYLVARIDTISNDLELFENIPKDQLANNGKVKKLKTSMQLINKIKQLEKYEIKVS